jgi:hypothetical protein
MTGIGDTYDKNMMPLFQKKKPETGTLINGISIDFSFRYRNFHIETDI